TRWRKNSFRPQLADFRTARSAVRVIDAPDVVSRQRLRRQRTGSHWERLSRRGNFAGDIGLGNRPLLDSENRLSGLPIQDEEIAGLRTNTDGWYRHSVPPNIEQDRWRGDVVVPQIVVDG